MGKHPVWTSTFASLRNRNFRLFSIGMLFSFTALQMQTLTVNYIVYQLAGTAKAIGYVSAASGFSMLLFSFAGGIAADRLPKRNLMAMSQAAIALVTLALGVLIATKMVQVGHIFVFSIIFGILSAFNMTARQSYMADLVGVKSMTNAQALIAGNMSITRIIGPAAAVLLIGLFGASPVFFIKATAHCLFVVLLLLIPVKGQASLSSRSILGDAIDGLRYLRRDRKILDLLLLGIVPIIFGVPYINFLPVFQKVVFHVGPSELGLMMSITGVGAIVGSLAMAVLSESRKKGRILFVTGAGFGASLLLFAITAGMGNFPASLVMLALVGATGTAFMALNSALVQIITPPEMHGRVQGVFIAALGLTSLGGLPMGMLVDAIGPSLTMGLFGAVTMVFVIVMVLARPSLRHL